MIKITAVHLVGGDKHEHIAEVRWTNTESGKSEASTREAMVEYIRKNPGRVVVETGGARVQVGVVDARPPYIRTFADGIPTDNLLALPRY